MSGWRWKGELRGEGRGGSGGMTRWRGGVEG